MKEKNYDINGNNVKKERTKRLLRGEMTLGRKNGLEDLLEEKRRARRRTKMKVEKRARARS